MTIDFKALAAKAVASGADQTQAKTGGGDYTIPAAGPALCRFVGYIETGKQEKTYKGVKSLVDEVQLVFELVGKRHPPIELDGGVKLPQRVTIKEKLSLNEKANFFKLFNRMNYKQDVQHLAALLGEGFKCEVVHDKWVGKDGVERTDAVLRNSSGYTIHPPRKEDEDSESGWVNVEVPPALTPPKIFLWQHADLQQWGDLFIEGEYPERKDAKGVVTAKAKSKNVLQNRILGAKNFEGSVIHQLLVASGGKIDLPALGEEDEEGGNEQGSGTTEPSHTAVKSSTTSPSNDALGGIV